MMAHTCHPSMWEAEAGALLRVQGQPGLHSKPLTQKQKDRGVIRIKLIVPSLTGRGLERLGNHHHHHPTASWGSWGSRASWPRSGIPGQTSRPLAVELCSLLVRNITYELPALRKRIAKCQQLQRECSRKEEEGQAGAAAQREHFRLACKQYGITVRMRGAGAGRAWQ